jgi:hypothetical protein
MSSEERQRQIRQQGGKPAEAEKQDSARSGREKLRQSEAERTAQQRRSPEEKQPFAEDEPDRPTPRR